MYAALLKQVCLCNEWSLLLSPLEQPYYLEKQRAQTTAGEALLQLKAINCSAKISENGAPYLCKVCYNLVMQLKNNYDVLERRASLHEQLAKSSALFV